jgi:ATP/ADP translocase
MQRIVPGHFRGITLALILLFSFVTFVVTARFMPVIGVVVMVIGIFIADQTGHLNQHHDELAPTPVERLMQKHFTASVLTGMLVAGAGLVMALLY